MVCAGYSLLFMLMREENSEDSEAIQNVSAVSRALLIYRKLPRFRRCLDLEDASINCENSHTDGRRCVPMLPSV